jgi:hypothetical protein
MTPSPGWTDFPLDFQFASSQPLASIVLFA